MPPLLILALVGVIALLVLIPTRRLYLAGWSQRALVLYFLAMLGLGLLVAELRGPARFLVPILVIGYLAPFVVASEGMARLMGRQPRRPVVRDVTPPPSLLDGTASGVEEPAAARGEPDDAEAPAADPGADDSAEAPAAEPGTDDSAEARAADPGADDSVSPGRRDPET